MRLLQTKWLSVIIGGILLALSPSVASAAAPHVIGYVKNKDTGEGIAGMVIKWEDSGATAPTDGDENGIRYTVTGADGQFRFPSWHLPPEQGGIGSEDLREQEHDTEIDTNYDGRPDSDKASDDKGYHFGCLENPHTFTLMLPRPGFDGQFEPPRITAELINGSGVQDIGTFYYTPTTPRCPSNIRHSCDASGTSATVSWDQPTGGADGYKLYYDRYPFHDIGEGDGLHSNLTNQLTRSFNVTPNTQYVVRVKSIRNSVESESCLVQFSCQCSGSACDGPKPPEANLVSCINEPDPYYRYTIANINTYGLPFINSRLMITFSYNAQTQKIMDFLNNRTNSSTADFSLWQERNRQRQEGDYLGFYIHTFDSLSGNSLTYQIGPNTRIGTRTMAEFRQYLINEGMPLQYNFKANMATRYGENRTMFNSHIPAPSRIDLSKDFNATCQCPPGQVCGGCPPGQVCPPPPPPNCPVITITQPAPGEVLTPVNNRVTVEWSATGATALTQYEVLIYDRSVYSSPQEAYQAYLVGTAVPIAMPDDLKVYTTTGTSQVVNFGDIDGLNPAFWMVAIRSTGVDASGQPCAWVITDPPPAPPGFPVSGNIYRYNPSCQPLEEVPIGGTITATGGHTFPVINGSFSSSLPDTGTNYALQLSLSDNTFDCANICGQGPSCVKDGINPTNNSTHFFVKEENLFTKSWWQVYGGYVFARNVMNSELPITDDNQSWRLMPPLIAGISETAGIPLTNRDRFGNDSPDNTNVAGWLREPPYQVPSANINESIKPDFAYFKDKLGLPSTTVPSSITKESQLVGQSLQGVMVYYFKGDTLTLALDETWNTPGHHVIMVEGNVRISAENLTGTDSVISTEPGGTKIIVATGNITVAGNVGNATIGSVNSNLSGIFIANQIIIQDDGNPSVEDKRFVGQGSFIGWNNVLLQRQFDNFELNENTPAETFVARPDLVVNLPEAVRDSSITWQEVN